MIFEKNLTNTIIKLMKRHERLRDDWHYLLAMVWKDQAGETDTLWTFLGKLANRQVYSPESIRRTWQKVLEENPDLRGAGYKDRQRHAERVKEEVVEMGEKVKPQETMDL